MDFGLGERAEAFRAEVRAFFEANVTEELEERCYRTGVNHDDAFVAAMRDAGLLAAGWPEEYGGHPRSSDELQAMYEELHGSDAPTYGHGTTSMVARAVLRCGTDEQRRDLLPVMLRGEVVCVLGFSEPESGSDIAAAQTRAVRDGDEWVVNGSKMFTTNAHVADYVFLLTRTNPDAPKHRGLTMFLVPMHQPGVEVQAVFTVSGERTNITYYSDVRVPDRYRIGDVDRGWQVLTGTLQDEHSAGFGPQLRRLLATAEAWAHETTDGDGRRRIDDPDVRERLARVAAEVEVSTLLHRRGLWMRRHGIVPEAQGPMSKLFSSEALERAAQELCEMVGPDALRSYLDPTAPQRGRIEHAMRFSLGTTIYGGSSEVQRNIVAERGLGLPRS
jgi:alkylation response protein AidB-like acyl-CoA dehydrogenase